MSCAYVIRTLCDSLPSRMLTQARSAIAKMWGPFSSLRRFRYESMVAWV